MTPSQGNLVFMLSLFYSVPLPTCHSPRTKQRFPSGKAYRSLEIYISFLERLTPQCGWIQVNEPILCTDTGFSVRKCARSTIIAVYQMEYSEKFAKRLSSFRQTIISHDLSFSKLTLSIFYSYLSLHKFYLSLLHKKYVFTLFYH